MTPSTTSKRSWSRLDEQSPSSPASISQEVVKAIARRLPRSHRLADRAGREEAGPPAGRDAGPNMKLAFGSDEVTAVTDAIVADLRGRGHEVVLFGPPGGKALQWADAALAV